MQMQSGLQFGLFTVFQFHCLLLRYLNVSGVYIWHKSLFGVVQTASVLKPVQT